MRRTIVRLLPIAAGGLAILWLMRPGDDAPLPPVPGAAYVVDVHRGQATVDLPFEVGSRYVLVLGNLGPWKLTESVSGVGASVARARTPARLWRTASSSIEGRPGVEPSPPADQRISHPPSATSPAHERTFALHVGDGDLEDPRQYVRIRAQPIATGRDICLYLDEKVQRANLAPGLVEAISDAFDRDLIPRFRATFGNYRDVDGDGRFSILLSPWLGRLQGGGTSVGGFVRGSDFQPRTADPFGNRCDMLYLNSQLTPGPALRTLLIHEYMHAVCFSRRSLADGHPCPLPDEEDWLNEAIAHCAETLFGGDWSNLDYRIAQFLNDSAAFPLVVDDYYRAGLWRCHGCRGATYLFLRYCTERFGPKILPRVIAAANRGTANIEWATGEPFARLFRAWTLSLLAETPPTASRFAPLALYGTLGSDSAGEWGLIGPCRPIWNVDSGPVRVAVKGTAAAYIELAVGSPGVRRIKLQSSAEARLQVSLMRLPDDRPRIDVAAGWSMHAYPIAAAFPRSVTKEPHSGGITVTIRASAGGDLSCTRISLEQNAGQTHRSICFSGETLQKLVQTSPAIAGQSKRPHSLEIPAGSERTFELPVDRLSSPELPIVIKAVTFDSRGRKACGWATVRRAPAEHLAERRF